MSASFGHAQVAVIAVLNTLGAPDRLSMLIAGESLLNDGVAVVIFLLLLQHAAGTMPLPRWRV